MIFCLVAGSVTSFPKHVYADALGVSRVMKKLDGGNKEVYIPVVYNKRKDNFYISLIKAKNLTMRTIEACTGAKDQNNIHNSQCSQMKEIRKAPFIGVRGQRIKILRISSHFPQL